MRIGLWLIVVGMLGIVLGEQALTAILQLGQRDAGAFSIISIANLVLTVAVVVGCVLCAIGSPNRRGWFVAAAACLVLVKLLILAPLVWMELHDTRWTMRGASLATYGAAATFAVGALGTAKPRLAWGLFGLAFVGFVLFVLRERPGVTSEAVWIVTGVLTMLRALLWIAVALDMLGAFPDDGNMPVARIHSRVRALTTIVAFTLCLAAIPLAATAMQTAQRYETASDGPHRSLALAIVVFAVGAAMLWHLRGRRISVSALTTGTIVAIVGGRFLLPTDPMPLASIDLAPQRFANMRISLPAGRHEVVADFRELGEHNFLPDTRRLGLVTVKWSTAEPSGGDGVPFTELERSVTVRGMLDLNNAHTKLIGHWQCPDDPRWFTLELVEYRAKGDADPLRDLARRMFDSIECNAASSAAAPPFSLVFTPPAGYDARPAAPQTVVYDGRDGDRYTLAWSASTRLAEVLDTEPATILQMFFADKPQWRDVNQLGRLTTLTIDDAGGLEESIDRHVFEMVVWDQRLLITAWQCNRFRVDAIALHTGPAATPAEQVLQQFRSMRCPR